MGKPAEISALLEKKPSKGLGRPDFGFFSSRVTKLDHYEVLATEFLIGAF
jgi:hypothetical protein